MHFLQQLSKKEQRIYLALSLLLLLWGALYVIRHTVSLSEFFPEIPFTFLRFSFSLLAVITVGAVFFYTPFRSLSLWIKKLFLIALPIETLFLIALGYTDTAHPGMFVLAGIYATTVTLFLAYLLSEPRLIPLHHFSFRSWLHAQGKHALVFVLLLTGIFGIFGTYRLGQFVAVDEALWLYGRIPKYWNALGDFDLRKTAISDKPGITVAIASGAALLKYEQPIALKPLKGPDKGIEEFFFAFRFPLVILAVLFLPLFYFLLERLFGHTRALFSYTFIALGPVTLGMTKIINPDGLLWIFAPLTLLAYLVFLKRKRPQYLFLAGVLLGLTLLTKYVGNIIVVFIFGLIFLEYIFRKETLTEEEFARSLKKSLTDYIVLILIALSTFTLLYPAVFLKPEKLLTATIYSEAFLSVAPIFLGIIFFLLIDNAVARLAITRHILTFFRRLSGWIAGAIAGIFLLGSLAALGNAWGGMKWFDFITLLNSPKSIGRNTDIFGVFVTNFYSLLFAITPAALILLLLGSLFLFKKSFQQTASGKIFLYLLLLIILYYAGATVNGVGSITRYQIILYPIAGILAGIAGAEAFFYLRHKLPSFRKKAALPFLLVSLAIMGLYTLLSTPYPLSYASSLLPAAFHTDVKDMGSGSYETAEFLNTLPDAKNLTVWTDKSGVCKIFVGRCKSNYDWRKYRKETFDYVVVSSGRQNRTEGRVMTAVEDLRSDVLRFDTYYGKRDDAIWELFINGRESQYIQVIPFTK